MGNVGQIFFGTKEERKEGEGKGKVRKYAREVERPFRMVDLYF